MARLPQEVLDKLANIAVLFEDRRAVMAILVKRLRPIGKIGNRPARFVVITADTGHVELDELLRTQRDLYARREAAGMRHTHGGLEAELCEPRGRNPYSIPITGGKHPSLAQIENDRSSFG